MEIFKISAFAIIALILVLIVKEQKKEIGVLIAIMATVMLAIYAITKLESVTKLLEDLINKSGINRDYLEIILKVIGIAYIVEMTKSICEDAGEKAIGTKVEIAGKIVMATLTVPILLGVIEVINKIL